MLNIPLARKVLEHIEAHPEEHAQAHFASKNECGTTACIAGHALLLSGAYRIDNFDGDEFDFFEASTGKLVLPSDTAQGLLGLTHDQREELFFALQDKDEALEYLRNLITDAERREALS